MRFAMAHSATAKDERMHLRLDSETKRKLERAAAYAHKSISEFVLGNALKAADRVIEKQEQVTLSGPDWDLFFDALVNPPEPNEKLKAAFQEFRSMKQ